jgi:hypothetical protein
MPRFLLPLLTLLAFTTLVPSASALTPRPGHYKGSHDISFDLTRYGTVQRLEINGHLLHYFSTYLSHDRRFVFNHRAGSFYRFKGHGLWLDDHHVGGDFRRYEGTSQDETNTYHTWHAHWTHE